MDRIAIIGCGGSGKSHMARELGGLLGLTPVYLDGLYYDRNWRPLEQEQFAAVQRELISASRWIIDGNYASTLPIRLQAADTVIFLDLPAWACLWGVVQRRLRHGGGQHDAIGVCDWVTWNFVWYIARYRRRMAPRVRQLIVAQATHADVVVLRDRRVVGLGNPTPVLEPSGRPVWLSHRGRAMPIPLRSAAGPHFTELRATMAGLPRIIDAGLRGPATAT